MKPSFLKSTIVKRTEREGLEDATSNWLKINEKLNTFTEEELKKMILLELQTKQRLHILHRLKRRFDRVRGDRERREIVLGSGRSLIMVDEKRPVKKKRVKRKLKPVRGK